MSELEIQYRVLGAISTNVYLLINKTTRETIIVDPADNVDYLLEQCRLRDYHLVAVLLTHGHADHIFGVPALREKMDIPVYACWEEKDLLMDTYANRTKVWTEPTTLEADIWVHDNDVLHIAGFDITVLHTPGHTAGSCCYYFEKEGVLISGDTLFFQSYGRTDLPTGSNSAMQKSLERLFKLPPDVHVFPGHGEFTTIEHELKYNPASF